MERVTEWIKESIGVCASIQECEEAQIIEQFAVLKQQYLAFSELERRNIHNMIGRVLSIEDAMYVLSCFCTYMNVDDFWEDVMLKLVCEEFDCYVGAMLEYQVRCRFNGPERYALIRRVHKRNVDRFEQLLAIEFPYIPLNKRNGNRILIVTEQILSEYHAPTRVVENFAYVLQEHLGYEVRILVLPSNMEVPTWQWLDAKHSGASKEFGSQMMQFGYRDTKLSVMQINMSGRDAEEYRSAFACMHEWNPLFVWGMGISNPVADLLKTFTSLAVMDMSTGCPVSEADVIVRLERRPDETESVYAAAMTEDQKQFFMDEKIPVIVEKAESAIPRAELGLPEERFLIAVVGNRLEEEIDASFVEVMKAVLEEAPEAAFVFIGEAESVKEHFREAGWSNRVFYPGYQESLMEVYNSLDLYVNPRRMGGGFSGTMALIAGLPVVTLPDCDVAYNVGEPFIVQSYEQMIKVVCRYVNDREFYREQKVHVRENARSHSNEKIVQCVQKMVNGIIRTIEEQE